MSEPSSDFESIQKQIDEIDRRLLESFADRRKLTESLMKGAGNPGAVGRVAEAAVRIDEVVSTFSESDPDDISARDQAAILKHVSSVCLNSVKRIRAAYLGPPYSYSHLAAIKFFGDATELTPVSSIEAVFESVEKGDVETGIVPIENSTDGRVVDTLGMFARLDMEICGEVLMPIHHNLLSKTAKTEITEVHSKPQALSQCRGWLSRHLPSAHLVQVNSTAVAAESASNTTGVAAVASIEAGRQYDLDVIAPRIEDNPNNVTRFAVLGRQRMSRTGNDKTAILFEVNHEPGALADSMAIFKDADLNLTWIESFPSLVAANEYLFFIELTGHRDDENVAGAIKRLADRAQRLAILGSYAKGQNPI